jgi:Na+:H+ antiporter, NhaC family
MTTPSRPLRSPRLGEALTPVGFLIVFIAGAVLNLEDLPTLPLLTPILEALARIPYLGSVLRASIPVQTALVGATAVAAVMAWRLGLRWKQIEAAFLDGIRLSLGGVLILLIVGVLIGTWIASGVVPLLIVWGLKLLSADWFLVAACLVCSIVSLATGSSWTTAGTIGVALIGVGGGLGLPLPIVAGAIISGAYFGDKMSPLSDTTNLAPGIAGADLFAHVRHMAFTTGPSYLIALLLYWIVGFGYEPAAADTAQVDQIVDGLDTAFGLSGWLVLPPLLVLALVVARVPALPALLVGAIGGGIAATVAQGATLAEVLLVAYDGYHAETGVVAVDELLTRGGFASMYGTVGIILSAMCFGGVMERSGMLARIAEGILSRARRRGPLVAATVGTSVGMNVVAADQYLALVVPGRMYREAYARAGLHPKNLSRALEDGGTLTSPLIPWNSCGAYMFATLGVFPLAYLPFAFLNLLNPLISMIYGYTGWTMARADAVAEKHFNHE